jgi:hypothetical protein
MAPEHAAVFEELRERAFNGGATTVEFMTSYYGQRREVRFGIRFERSGWDHSFYAKTISELLGRFQSYLDERGL